MDYYLNEYSLRGQFASVEDFFESLRNYTFPILTYCATSNKLCENL